MKSILLGLLMVTSAVFAANDETELFCKRHLTGEAAEAWRVVETVDSHELASNETYWTFAHLSFTVDHMQRTLLTGRRSKFSRYAITAENKDEKAWLAKREEIRNQVLRWGQSLKPLRNGLSYEKLEIVMTAGEFRGLRRIRQDSGLVPPLPLHESEYVRLRIFAVNSGPTGFPLVYVITEGVNAP